jgi:RNA polymerase sigma-70 factor (ECF subfamily)
VKDSAGFDAFYAASHRRVLQLMHVATGSFAEAQRVTLEAYARAWARWRSISATDSPEAWVRTVAWRLATSRWRRARASATAMVRPRVPEPGFDILPSPFLAALSGLSEPQRRAVVLHYLGDLSVAEVAHEVGVSEGTVKVRLFRGRAALADVLAESPDGSDVAHGSRGGGRTLTFEGPAFDDDFLYEADSVVARRRGDQRTRRRVVGGGLALVVLLIAAVALHGATS